MGEWVHTNDGRPLKTTDAMLDEMEMLYRTRRSTIRVALAYKAAFPEMAEQMEWLLTVGLEATEKELARP
jgi:hypothetical protein